MTENQGYFGAGLCLIGAVIIASALFSALRSGKFKSDEVTYDRQKQPRWFWFHVAVAITTGIASILIGAAWMLDKND